MIEQAELNRAFFARYGEPSRAELFGRHGEPSRAELFFPKARAKTELSRAELRLGPNTRKYLLFSYRTLRKNRITMLAITILMSLGFIFGITSTHFQQDGITITFLVIHLILALVIFIFRVFMDDQV